MAKYRFDNMDAGESAFFSRQLEHLRPGLLEVQFAELKGKSFVPVNSAVSPADEEFTYRYHEMFGVAELSSDYSERGPRSDIKGTEASSKIRAMKASYGYSLQESRAAAKAGFPLDARKARAARRAIEQLHDEILLLGDGTAPYLGLRGLFKLAGTATYSTPNGGEGLKTWESKSPDEVVADLHGIANGIALATNDVERPNTLILPLSSYNLISTRRMGDGSNVSILDFFRGSSQYVRDIMSSVRLETAGAGGTKRMVCYDRNPDKLEAIVPVEFEQLAPQWDGFEVVTQCHARTGGVVCYFPKSVSYGDGI